LNTNIVPVKEVRVGTTPDGSTAIVHLTTVDKIPIAVELPSAVLGEFVEQLGHVLQRLDGGARSGKRLH
jgi:hypothetical protein